MPRNVPISFGSMSYQSSSHPWNAQRLVNWQVELSPPEAESRSPLVLLPRPGLRNVADISGECRALYPINDVLYGVWDNKLYSIATDYTITELGTILSSGQVYISDNGSQLQIVVAPNSYTYDISSSIFSQVTDVDYAGASSLTHLTGYFIFSKNDDSGEFFVSDQLDGTSFDALNFATAEMDSDRLLRPFADHGELWLFGAQTTEIWTPSGTSDFPFQRATNAGPERGIGPPDSVAKFDNTLCWVGNDNLVYRSNGYSPIVISTRPIEKIIASSENRDSITGRAYTQNGHPTYILHSKDDGWTLVYDATTNRWAERATYGYNYWRYVNPVLFNQKILAGGIGGGLFELDTEVFSEDGETIVYEATSPPVHANGQRVSISRLEILMETGVGLNNGQGNDPKAMLQWSKDGGKTWSNEHWADIGEIGEYSTRVVWRNLGQAFSWIFRFSVSDPVKPVVIAAYADIDITPP